MTVALCGCQTISGLNPVNLYHGLEGGPIADARPPPPNADAPYPNLANVPDKPTDSADALARGRIASGLIADRAHAQYEASVIPLPPPSTGAPVSRGAPPPVKVDPDASSATLAAASAPPAPNPPPNPIPIKPAAIKPASVDAPVRPPRPAPTTPVIATPLPDATAEAAAEPMPDVPTEPPPPPRLPGVAAVTAPAPPPEPPPPPPPPTAPSAAIPVAFAHGSSSLPPATLATLRGVAARRGTGSIGVTGFGEAASDTPSAQVSSIPLAFARARSIAAQLEAAGVPASAIRLDAEAVGSGGAVRILP